MTLSAPSTIAERRARLRAARLYLVTCARPGGRPLVDVLGPALAGGVDIVQLRDKRLDDEELLRAATTAGELCRAAGALLIVNDRPELVERAGADGAHVGQDDVPVARARVLAGPRALVGVSTHGPEQLAAAGEAGADYAGVGPVHATPTKPGRPAVGLAYVEHAARAAELPWFAIGGIDEAGVTAVVEAGAARVAVVRAITEAADPAAAARALRAAVERRPLPGGDDGPT